MPTDSARGLIGVFLSHANDVVGPDLACLPAVASSLEDAHVDYVSVADHVVLGPDLSAHAALGGSALGYPLDEPYPDPLVTLAAVAAVTSRMRLLTGVLIAPLRPPVLLAKSVATLAALSGGRLDLGVGSGWQRAEYGALGVPIEDKVQRLEDGLAACRALWGSAPAAFRSPTVAFDGLHCFPQPPGGDVPIWFAGKPVPATLRRVAALGAGWLPIRQLTPDEARTARRDLDSACAEAGREPSSVGIRCPVAVPRRADGERDSGRLRDEIAALTEAGVDGVHLPLRQLAASADAFDDALDFLDALVANTAGLRS